ncbi:unnamed protein product [Staurois parvus]|uniref:Secreted protein n=1 Tax=Staurois parvus TaxID=386267 RepID=A0ABN9DLL8_9NEOB|nr:unnamed protein product [Staurois parvus]
MYVKCFDTVMFYYVILVNVTFCHFLISRRSVPRMSRRSQGMEPRRQMPASAGLHCGDTAGGTSWERRTR